MCEECYSNENRITPLINPIECLSNHPQYICSKCGRCICMGKTSSNNLQRWNFPFKSVEIALLYLRTADYTMKKSCGIYEIISKNNRKSYRIFPSQEALLIYLKKNKDKNCINQTPIYINKEYQEFPNTQVRMLVENEINKYLKER